jgi:hypothetical protein
MRTLAPKPRGGAHHGTYEGKKIETTKVSE